MEQAVKTPFVEEINFKEIEVLEVVGKGSFGVVNKARWRDIFVAVKMIDTDSEKKAFLVERQQLSRVNHPNIVKLYGACTKSPVCLVMEYAEGGSLYNVLHGTPQPDYTAAHAISWVYQCALGVAYLHDMKPKALIHRDLKPPNLLLVLGGTVLKICDFGTACDIQTQMTNNKGSAAWMAPEVFEGCKYSEKCDVFSWGIILWEVITRRKPFDEVGTPAYRIMWAVHSGQRPPLIKGCPRELEILMTSCWDKEPHQRPPMGDVVSVMSKLRPYFKGADEPIQYLPNDSVSSMFGIYETEESTRNSLEMTTSELSQQCQVQNSLESANSSPAREQSPSIAIPIDDITVVTTPPSPTVTKRTIVIEDPPHPLLVDVSQPSTPSQTSAPPSLASSRENLLIFPGWMDNTQKRLSDDLSGLKISDLKIDVGQPASPTHRRTGSYGSLVTSTLEKPFFTRDTLAPSRPAWPSPPTHPPPITYKSNYNLLTSWQQQQQQQQALQFQPNTGSEQENFSNFVHRMLEPQYLPVAPFPNSKESMQIFTDHRQMADEYLQVQSDLAFLTQRKKQLAEELEKTDKPLDQQCYSDDPNKCFEELLQLQSEKKGLQELHHNLKRQLQILNQPRPQRKNTGDSWEILNNE